MAMAAPGHVDYELVTPAEQDISRFRQLRDHLPAAPQSAQLTAPDGSTTEVPEALYEVLRQVVGFMAEGATIRLVPLHRELTTQQAADLLNVSHPFLIKLLDDGAIPFTHSAAHRRLFIGDVTEYKRQRDRTRRAALDNMTAMAEEYGEYDDTPGMPVEEE